MTSEAIRRCRRAPRRLAAAARGLVLATAGATPRRAPAASAPAPRRRRRAAPRRRQRGAPAPTPASPGAQADQRRRRRRRLRAAQAENKPVFVYWGAKWCPPCNQVKATLFNRQDFIERSRAFVPVYVDGDSPGAQKLGARFKVSGYPTMVLFNPQGQELTRLPGEVDPGRYTQVLTLGMNAQRPVKAVLADALAGGAGLTPTTGACSPSTRGTPTSSRSSPRTRCRRR